MPLKMFAQKKNKFTIAKNSKKANLYFFKRNEKQ